MVDVILKSQYKTTMTIFFPYVLFLQFDDLHVFMHLQLSTTFAGCFLQNSVSSSRSSHFSESLLLSSHDRFVEVPV